MIEIEFINLEKSKIIPKHNLNFWNNDEVYYKSKRKIPYPHCSSELNHVLSDSQKSLLDRKIHSFFNFLKLAFNCFNVGHGEPMSTETVLPTSPSFWHLVIESVIVTGCSCIVKSVSFLNSMKVRKWGSMGFCLVCMIRKHKNSVLEYYWSHIVKSFVSILQV